MSHLVDALAAPKRRKPKPVVVAARLDEETAAMLEEMRGPLTKTEFLLWAIRELHRQGIRFSGE